MKASLWKPHMKWVVLYPADSRTDPAPPALLVIPIEVDVPAVVRRFHATCGRPGQTLVDYLVEEFDAIEVEAEMVAVP